MQALLERNKVSVPIWGLFNLTRTKQNAYGITSQKRVSVPFGDCLI